MNYIAINNNTTIAINKIPEVNYKTFYEECLLLTKSKKNRHCVAYFGYHYNKKIKIICAIADDIEHNIYLLSSVIEKNAKLESLSPINLTFVNYEREIHEQFGIDFKGHPWLKPLRYAFNRFDKSKTIENYPFLEYESDELHEVGVGPIHAGIIEPGHFRFICNGEQIIHLEIQLGYQHRGIEELMIQKKKLLERTTIIENTVGDSTVAYTSTFANLWESLCNTETLPSLSFTRTLAQEIERMAIHTGDLSTICTDIAYQLGSAVFGRLRTPIINFFQEWTGNRFAKGLIRTGKTNYPFTEQLGKRILEILAQFEPHFIEMGEQFFSLPSVLSRIEKTGTIDYNKVVEIGAVGMVARTSGLNRDIRRSHPYNYYTNLQQHEPIIIPNGDVYARSYLRYQEVLQSIQYVRQLIEMIPDFQNSNMQLSIIPQPNCFAISLSEGWRGEICHCAITNTQGDLIAYKIKDPSFHNWKALELAVRNNEISDFPICNKSFNLSYCGYDL